MKELLILITTVIVIVILITGCTSSQDIPWKDVQYKQTELNQIQLEVNDGHKVSYLNAEAQAMDFAGDILKFKDMKITNISNLDDKKILVKIHSNALRKDAEIVLYQPNIKGKHGIWIVLKYRVIQ